MKRKRGKKGKSKKPPKVGTTEAVAEPNINNLSLSGEEESGPDDTEKDETNSKMDIETPSTGTDQTEKEKPPPVRSAMVTDNKPVGRLVYNRVKLKIKPSKALEPQITSSDAHTHSDADKSSQLIGLEKQPVSEKVEDSANSVSESNLAGVSVTQPKKSGSIKIKSFKGFGSSLSPCSNAGVPKTEKTLQKESEPVSQESVYNKQELHASLEVIKNIMKMEAAEPFIVPVNPVVLGIPDYFDVIKTPMDFETICSNLESGVKYMNSEDVYKDVQYIWENCYKYNNKGDYILELMKRVKKNFSKYWTAAGLYNEQKQGDMKDGNKSSSMSGNLKHKSRKRHGGKRHKDDCLCAICIMVRRRQEREHIMNPADDQTETSDGLVHEVKPEGNSAMGTPTSSSTDNSQKEDADAEMEDKGGEVKLEKELQSTLQSKQQEEKEKETRPDTNEENAIVEQSQVDGKSGTEKDRDVQMAEAGDASKDDVNNEEKTKQHKDETAAVEHQKPKELMDANEKAKLYENLHQRYDNPMVLDLCASLFPQNPKSLWSKHHSLVSRDGSTHNSSIGAAIATFIKY